MRPPFKFGHKTECSIRVSHPFKVTNGTDECLVSFSIRRLLKVNTAD